MTVSNGNTGLSRPPLQNSGSLSHLDYVEVTPIIGREYPTAKIRDILHAPNAEQQIRDLAITICERGVVFFRAPQDDLTIEEQKRLTVLLGELTGRPEGHGLHVHPLFRDENNIPMGNGQHDESIYVINAKAAKKLYKSMRQVQQTEPKDLGLEWHSDCISPLPVDMSYIWHKANEIFLRHVRRMSCRFQLFADGRNSAYWRGYCLVFRL